MGRSLREYGRRVFLTWWGLVCLIGGIIGLAALFVTGGITLPTWIGLVVATLCLLTAQFHAFHQVRVQRDGSGEPRTVGGITVAGDMHVHIHPPAQPPPV